MNIIINVLSSPLKLDGDQLVGSHHRIHRFLNRKDITFLLLKYELLLDPLTAKKLAAFLKLLFQLAGPTLDYM